MSYSGSSNSCLPPFDPWLQPELFRGVLEQNKLDIASLRVDATPRRLVLRAEGIPEPEIH